MQNLTVEMEGAVMQYYKRKAPGKSKNETGQNESWFVLNLKNDLTNCFLSWCGIFDQCDLNELNKPVFP